MSRMQEIKPIGVAGVIDWNQELSDAGYAGPFIRKFVRSMRRRFSVRSDDLDDLQQDLRIALLEASSAFDPTLGNWMGFVRVVVNRNGFNWFRARNRRQLGFERSMELAGELPPSFDEDGEEVEVGAEWRDEDVARWSGRALFNPLGDWIEREHQETILAQLDPELRSFAEDLRRVSPQAAVRARGWSKSWLVHQLDRLRKSFSEKSSQNASERSGFGE